MNKTFQLLSFFIFLSSLLQGQEHIPIHIDSLLKFQKKHQIIKWNENDVEKMDSIHRPKYYEGGVLIMPLKKHTALDTVEIADITGIDYKKVKMIPIVSKHSFIHNKFMQTGPVSETSFRNHIFIQDQDEIVVFYKFEAIPRSGFISPPRDYALLPEFEAEFPDGLAKKQVVLFRVYYDSPYIISWKKWEDVDKEKLEKNFRPNPYLEYYRDKENIYYVFRSGYYSEWSEAEAGKRFVTKIQIALKEKEYNVAIDGNWNRRTHIALIKFQKEFFLYKNTYGELLEELGIED